jgi:nucleotide-binding universal stress UspA family protein
MSRLRSVLHPSDFSRASGAAFARAVVTAKADRAQLLLVHVLSPAVPIAGEGYISSKVYDDLEAKRTRRGT